ncbi:cobalt-precorrin 5A hydrolase [uncultured Selenomonas sp.]|uniref:cobalt-precorrin 5A hydrolase n=1 Tax=uncultured Selenomonas sp. TaxID=159275 RepID=UPI00260118C9|nr:cobalamin biosynthesis protein [uncultured Selenomonas sp.]
MRTAVLALTREGAKTARRVKLALPDADVYLSQRVFAQRTNGANADPTRGVVTTSAEERTSEAAIAGVDDVRTFGRIVQATTDVFPRYDALIFIMATGIVVRSIAPLVRDKLADPAVVVMDEQAKHVISLLSGHVGGANALTRQLAAALGSDAVITTATDVEGLVAPDTFAQRFGLQPWPHGAILKVNRALLEGATVRYIVDDVPLAALYRERLKSLGFAVLAAGGDIPFPSAERPHAGGCIPCSNVLDVVITDTPERFPEHGKRGGLFLRPMRLIAGVGCRKDTSRDDIEAALKDATKRIGLPIWGIEAIASTVVKREERGLLDLAEMLKCPIQFFDNDKLAHVIKQYDLRESPFVKKTIGVGNVAEAAALAEAGPHARIALGKTKYEKVTVALVWQKLP